MDTHFSVLASSILKQPNYTSWTDTRDKQSAEFPQGLKAGGRAISHLPVPEAGSYKWIKVLLRHSRGTKESVMNTDTSHSSQEAQIYTHLSS